LHFYCEFIFTDFGIANFLANRRYSLQVELLVPRRRAFYDDGFAFYNPSRKYNYKVDTGGGYRK